MCGENREDSDIPDNEGTLANNKLDLHTILFSLILDFKNDLVSLLSFFHLE